LIHIKPAIHLEGWLHGEFQGIPYIQMSLHEMKLIITWLKMIAKKNGEPAFRNESLGNLFP